MIRILKNEMIDITGKASVPTALAINLGEWFLDLGLNQWLTLAITVFSLIYIILKIYNGYLEMRGRKLDLKFKQRRLDNGDA